MTRRPLFAACLTAAVLTASAVKAQNAVATDAPCATGDCATGNCPTGDCNNGPPPTKTPGRLKRMWASVCRDFKRNNTWPDPFVASDRASTRLPFDICVANGWRFQNTLSDHHFVDGRGELTPAGRLQVSAIINNSPVNYRAIFVLRSPDPAVTAERVASVQEAASLVIGDRPPVPIFETYDNPRGASAYYVDEVTRRYQATIPDPRIPDTDDSGSGSGSGSGYGSGSN